MRVRLALAQMEVGLDVGANLEKIGRFARLARRKKADIVAFPEIAVTGNDDSEGSVDRKGAHLSFFRSLAKENGLDIVTGSIIEGSGKSLFNSIFYIDRRGKVLGRYRKRNLWVGKEKDRITGGRGAAVIETRFGKVGLLICWDIIRPEYFKELCGLGAEIAICPSYWWEEPKVGMDGNAMKSIIATRAFENEMVVAFCNAAGSDGRRTLLGTSQVVSPCPLEADVLEGNGEGLLVSTVDTDSVDEAERNFMLRRRIRI